MSILPAMEEPCVAYLVCDAALRITASSPNIVEVFGSLDAPLIGALVTDAIPPLHDQGEGLRAVLTGTHTQLMLEAVAIRRPDGDTCIASMYALPFNGSLLILLTRVDNQVRLEQHVQQQYDELEQLHQQIATHNEELMRRSQRTAELLALITYDIRVWLNDIDRRVATLLTADQSGAQHELQAALRLIKQDVQQTLDLTRGAADVQRLVAAANASQHPVELDLLVQQVVDVFREHATRRGVRLTYERGGAIEQALEPLVLVQGSSDLMQYALVHLISIGLRQLAAGRTMLLRLNILPELPALEPPLNPAQTWCLLEIEDDGVGFAADVLACLSDPAALPDGGCLGLLAAQQAIRQHGGQLRVQIYPAAGTLMQVYLPCVWDATLS